MPRRCLRLALLLLGALSHGGCGPIDLGRGRQAITDGTPHLDHPATGELLVGSGPAFALCTATLVGQRTVVTAAHCVSPGQPHRFRVAAQTFLASSAVRHPDYQQNASPYPLHDLAVLRLAQAPAVSPSVLGKAAPVVGQQLTLVGFGATAEGATDLGIKRTATNVIGAVAAGYFTFDGTGGGKGNICEGDSGGPAFSTLGGQELLVGVASAGVKPCGTRGVHTRLDVYLSWLDVQAAGDLRTQSSDSTAPRVVITTPAPNASVAPSLTVEATAEDAVGVVAVEFLVGATAQATLTRPPYRATLSLSEGAQTIRVTARDAAGNVGSAEVSVRVASAPVKQGFGGVCQSASDCASAICLLDQSSGQTFCSARCDSVSCPNNAPCRDVSGQRVCGPGPSAAPDGASPSTKGGCRVTDRGSSDEAWWILVLWVVVSSAAARRGRRWPAPARARLGPGQPAR